MSGWIDAISEDGADWDRLTAVFPHFAAMNSCMQDPIHHREGDVWTHTRMVDASMEQFGLRGFAAHLTALYHDVEKPSTKETVDGRVTHHRHAKRGAQTAWFDLWMAGTDVQTRLRVYGLILWHQRVFHMWDYPDMDRLIQSFALLGSWEELIAFARADSAGRICDDGGRDENLILLGDYVRENLIELDPVSRFQYLRREDRSRFYIEQPPKGSRLTMMCGLPGSGKDTHIRNHHAGKAVISLDAIRAERKIKWTDDQTPVVVEAYSRARELLRRREDFVWNATSLTRLYRNKLTALAADYDAHIRIEALDRAPAVVLKQDSGRSIDQQVSKDIIFDLARRWEPPTLMEAHEVCWV